MYAKYNPKKSYTRKRLPYRKKTYKKTTYRRKALPSRLRSSKLTYQINRKINKAINRFSENKLASCISFNQATPSPIQTGAQAYFLAFNTGLSPTFTGSRSIDGIRIVQGTSAQQRVGDYVYLQKTHVSFKLEMINANTITPTQFRMLVIKLRRYNNPAGVTSVPEESLFLRPDGTKFGHSTAAITGLDLMMQPTNKRDWVIYKDMKFTLQNYNNITQQSVIYNHYPCFKDIHVNFPYYKKTKYGVSNDLPIDMDYRYTVIFYAHNVARETTSEDFEITSRGTTSYKDN